MSSLSDASSITNTRMNGSSSAFSTWAANITLMSGSPGIMTNSAANPMKNASRP